MSSATVDFEIRRWFTDVRYNFQITVIVALAYFLAAQLAFLVGTLSDKIFAPVWPPNIVLFCALLLTPVRRWWIIVLAVLPAHVLAELGVGMHAPQLVIAFLTNCLVAMINAGAVQYLLGRSQWFASLRNMMIYITITAVVGPAFSALGGAFVQISGGGDIGHYGLYWARWYASNALGAVTLGPIALLCLSEGRISPALFTPTLRRAEAVMGAVVLILTCTIAFNVSVSTLASGYLPTLLYLPLPLILWLAVRFGVRGASGAVAIVSMVLIWRTLNGANLFALGDATADTEANVFALQIFLLGLSTPILLLGAAIEDVHRAERETRESEERMASAAESSDVGFWRYQPATGTVWATDHCRAMFGLSASGPPDLDSLLSRVHPGDLQAVSAAMKSVVRNHESLEIEFRLADHDNKVCWINARLRPHFDDRSGFVAMTGSFADITKRKLAESEAGARRQEIAHLMRVSMLGELSGGLAHELTQPLTAILSNAQAGKMLLTQGNGNPKVIGDIFDDIITEDGRAGEIIHRLRGLLKKGEVGYEAVDINELIVSTIRLLHSELISRRVTINHEISPGLPAARGDQVQLQQVLLNLFMNAMDAMDDIAPPRRVITVRTGEKGDEVEICIADRGIGLPEIAPRSVFQPFFTTKKRGLGLGLSICSSIIKSHGGTLSLENNPGEGATASFRLPIQRM